MSHPIRLVAYGTALVLCATLMQTPVVSQEELAAGPVDFRMAPLEQAKKISRQVRQQDPGGVTMTVMNRWSPGERTDRQHLILPASAATPSNLQRQLAGNFDSVSWSSPEGYYPFGSCDNDRECEKKTEDMCKNAGHGGVKPTSVKITVHLDGSKTCSGDCKQNGAVAFVTCDPIRG